MTKIENTSLTIAEGFRPEQRAVAVRLFWMAFEGKLSLLMNPEDKALAFLERVADPAHALSASLPDGTLVGIAGFKTKDGSFIGGELADVQAVYGWVGGLWRGLALSVLERPLEAGTLTMDGIMVSEAARGQGVGSALLSAIKEKAAKLDCTTIRLDVVDTNPRARALYERRGFVARETTGIGPLRYIFGFRTSTMMICPVHAPSQTRSNGPNGTQGIDIPKADPA